jgi:hypothetical protein
MVSAASGQAKLKASDLLKQYRHREDEEAEEEELFYRRLFAQRTAHLPGNGWCADWIMWFKNNHPLLALCCRDKRNPVGLWPRLVILLTSISLGLICTNLIYLYFRSHPESNVILLVFEAGASNEEGERKSFQVTTESVVVWTFGSILHSLFDLGIWHLNGCACCINSIFAKIGPIVSIALSASLCAFSTLVILWRANYEDGKYDVTSEVTELEEEDNSWLDLELPTRLDSFEFLLTYWIELFTVWVSMEGRS